MTTNPCPLCTWTPNEPESASTPGAALLDVTALCYEHQFEYLIATALEDEQAAQIN